MKESLSGLWNYLSVGWAKRFMKRWLTWVRKSDLTPMRKVGEMLFRHLDNILTFCRHRITNGAAEGLNSKIMAIKRRACGTTSRPPSASSAAAWTSIPDRHEPGYPRKTRKGPIRLGYGLLEPESDTEPSARAFYAVRSLHNGSKKVPPAPNGSRPLESR